MELDRLGSFAHHCNTCHHTSISSWLIYATKQKPPTYPADHIDKIPSKRQRKTKDKQRSKQKGNQK